MKTLVLALCLFVLVVGSLGAYLKPKDAELEAMAKDLLKLLNVKHSQQKAAAAPGRNNRGSCSCTGSTCSCCHTQDLSFIGTHTLCGEVGYDEAAWTAWYKVTFDGDVIISELVDGHDPPAVCVPVPKIPFLSICTDFYNVDYANNVASGCLKMSVTFGKWGVTQNLGTVDVGCFSFNVNTIKKGGTSADLIRIMNDLANKK